MTPGAAASRIVCWISARGCRKASLWRIWRRRMPSGWNGAWSGWSIRTSTGCISSSCLLDFGTRVQESVFVANLEEAHAERMERRLERLVHPDLDRLHIFELCASCGRKTKVHTTRRY